MGMPVPTALPVSLTAVSRLLSSLIQESVFESGGELRDFWLFRGSFPTG